MPFPIGLALASITGKKLRSSQFSQILESIRDICCLLATPVSRSFYLILNAYLFFLFLHSQSFFVAFFSSRLFLFSTHFLFIFNFVLFLPLLLLLLLLLSLLLLLPLLLLLLLLLLLHLLPPPPPPHERLAMSGHPPEFPSRRS